MAPDGTASSAKQAESPPPGATETPVVSCSMREFLLYFVRLGTFGFGGPIALAAAYLRYGGLSWMQGAFYSIGAAVIAWKLMKLTLKRDYLLWAVFLVTGLSRAKKIPEPLVIMASGVAGVLWKGGLVQ